MKRLSVLVATLIFIGAQTISADSLTFRKKDEHKCVSAMCGEYRGGTVETGTVSRNGRFVGTYREYRSKDGTKSELDLNIKSKERN